MTHEPCPVCGANEWLLKTSWGYTCLECGTEIDLNRINDRTIRWVNVKDRLPEEEKEYYVRIAYEDGTNYNAMRWWMRDGIWYDDVNETEYPVTHWLEDKTGVSE